MSLITEVDVTSGISLFLVKDTLVKQYILDRYNTLAKELPGYVKMKLATREKYRKELKNSSRRRLQRNTKSMTIAIRPSFYELPSKEQLRIYAAKILNENAQPMSP